MGQPATVKPWQPRGWQPGELKHLSTRRKRKQAVIPQVVASERGIAQTGEQQFTGVVGPTESSDTAVEARWKAAPQGVTVPYTDRIGTGGYPE